MKNVEDIYPPSPLQESLLFHVLAAPGSSVGFEQKSMTLRGPLDVEAFDRTWQRVVDRHPILRTLFLIEGVERPLQVVRRRVRLGVHREDWRDLTGEEQRRRLREFLRRDRELGFDLANPPLMRVALLRTANDAHQLVWSYHHLLLDAWCRNLLLKEVFSIYTALARGLEPVLPDSRPFRDYIAWLERQDPERSRRFWRRTLGGFQGALPLRFGAAVQGPAGESAGSGERHRLLSQPLSRDLQDFARSRRLTLGTLVQGAWAIALSRTSGADDIVYGITVSGRPPDLPGVESMLGMFVNNLPVRIQVRPQAPAADWFAAFQEQLSELRCFEHCSPGQIQEAGGPPSGGRLFDSLVLFQNYPSDLPVNGAGGIGAGGITLESYSGRLETAYPITLVAAPGERIPLRIQFQPGVLDDVSAERLLGHLETLLAALASGPERPLAELPMLTEAERHQIQVEWNGRPVELEPAGTILAALVREAAAGRMLRLVAPGAGEPPPIGVPAELWSGEEPTGWAARHLADGRLELYGRHGRSVTISGRRIDPGEIEAALRRHPGLRDVAVVVETDAAGRPALHALVVAVAGEVEAGELRRFLRSAVPAVQMPMAFSAVESLPRRVGGMPDADALARVPRLPLGGGEIVPPRDALELRLVQLWEEIFGFAPIGITDDFFALGGRSLLALRLVTELRKRFGRDLPLSALLGGATVERLAELLRQRDPAPPGSPLVRIQEGRGGRPLFCIHPGGGNVLCYVDLAYHLGSDLPVYGLQAWGREVGQMPLERVEEMAAAYLDAARTVQGTEPYRLLGWSFGGLVAWEMARRLYERGEEVELLAVLDAGVEKRSWLDDAELLAQFAGDELGISAEVIRGRGELDEMLRALLAEGVRRRLLPHDFDLAAARRLFAVRKASKIAAWNYVPRPCAAAVTLFVAREGRRGGPRQEPEDLAGGWRELAWGGVEVVPVPGSHETLVRRPHVEALAAALKRRLHENSWP